MTIRHFIQDKETYLKNMRKSMFDKLFFLSLVETDYFIDYGCADGIMIKHGREMLPNSSWIGYDISEEMLRRARENCPDVAFYNNIEEIKKVASIWQTTLVLSSVLHEIYSYSTKKEIANFWAMIENTSFKYIVIRDMMPANSIIRKTSSEDYANVNRQANSYQIKDWEKKWGSLWDNKSLVHFLLTYGYVSNWEREKNENYFPLTLEEFLPMIPECYSIEYMEHYTLPYFKQKVKKDFGIAIKDNTHIKLILKRG